MYRGVALNVARGGTRYARGWNAENVERTMSLGHLQPRTSSLTRDYVTLDTSAMEQWEWIGWIVNRDVRGRLIARNPTHGTHRNMTQGAGRGREAFKRACATSREAPGSEMLVVRVRDAAWTWYYVAMSRSCALRPHEYVRDSRVINRRYVSTVDHHAWDDSL